MRFDCSRFRRVVVAGPSRSTQGGLHSAPPQICSQSAGRASAIGAATGPPQRTEYVSIAAISRGAAGPMSTTGRCSVIRW